MAGGIDLREARRHELRPGETAWPTVAVFAAALGVQLEVARAALAGDLADWVAVLVASACAYAQFTVVHDAAHRCASKISWLNEALGIAATLVLFGPFSAMRRNHLHHHAHTNDPHEDRDYWVAGKTLAGTLLRLHTQYWRHYWCFFTKLARRDSVTREAVLTVVFLICCFALAATRGFAGPFFLYWLLPAQIGSAALAFAFDYWPHRPHRFQGRLKDTAIIAPRALDPLFLYQNLHLLHHLFPTIPWFRYRAAYGKLEPGIRAEGGLIWDMRTALSRLGCAGRLSAQSNQLLSSREMIW